MIFTKMHGIGNDFIVISDNNSREWETVAVEMCDRHFGVGADGILVVEKSEIADSKMLIYNSDGSQAEMCGNGIRCFAKYLYDTGIVRQDIMRIETLDGIKEISINTDNGDVTGIRVNMDKPVFNAGSIPLNMNKDRIVNEMIEVDGAIYNITSMLMGVPHTVLFVDDVMNYDINTVGKKIEHSKLFPKRTNVNFVEIVNRNEFRVRTWERGAGATLACGTGTCASLVACVLNGKTDNNALTHLPGGDLLIDWDSSGYVYMTGPAETVFTGEYKNIP